MERVVVGLEDEATGRVVLEWIIERAGRRPMEILLVAALDVSGSNPGEAKARLAGASRVLQDSAADTRAGSLLADRPLLHELLAQSESADLIAIGSHPHPGIREYRTPSFPVSLAARSQCTVAVVPEDRERRDGPVVVGVDAAGDAFAAVRFAAQEAAAAALELVVVHTWEPWAAPRTRTVQVEHEGILAGFVDRVRDEFPALGVHGELREAVAHEGIIASSGDASLVVLGTHRLGRESGLVLGAIHQEVMMRGGVPLCVVPLS
jgi:nucleotide-binding universal stress UspA family protein